MYDYGYGNVISSNVVNLGALGFIAFILAIVVTVLIFVFVLSKKREGNLKGFWAKLADFFNLKHLYIEKVLQVIYVFNTCLFELLGFAMLFKVQRDWYGEGHWMGGYGILIMILSPIVIRLTHELIMMGVLLVKNVMQINSKLKDQTEGDDVDIFKTPDVDLSGVEAALKKTAESAQSVAKAGLEKAKEAKENLEAKAAERKAEAEAAKAAQQAEAEVKEEFSSEAETPASDDGTDTQA